MFADIDVNYNIHVFYYCQYHFIIRYNAFIHAYTYILYMFLMAKLQQHLHDCMFVFCESNAVYSCIFPLICSRFKSSSKETLLSAASFSTPFEKRMSNHPKFKVNDIIIPNSQLIIIWANYSSWPLVETHLQPFLLVPHLADSAHFSATSTRLVTKAWPVNERFFQRNGACSP